MSEVAQFVPYFLCALAEFEHYAQHAVTAQAALRACCTLANGGKGAFDRLKLSNALPVLSREVEKAQQIFAVLDQVLRDIWVLSLEGSNELVKDSLCILACLSYQISCSIFMPWAECAWTDN